MRRKRLRAGRLLNVLRLVLFITPVLILAQDPSPAEREAVIAQIQAHAARHVDNTIAMNAPFVVELFRDNEGGLTPREVAYLYEEEYSRLAQEKQLKEEKEEEKPEPLLPWLPNAGWWVSLVLVVWLVLKDVLKGWLSGFFKTLGEKLYGRLAGKPVFWGAALRHYQQALRDKCSKLQIAFRPNQPLGMREIDVYVPLQVAGTTDTQQIETELLVTTYRRSMINGAPGSGKSMLLKHLALCYARGWMEDLPDRPVPVLLKLHRFNDPTVKLEELLVEELARNDFPRARHFVSRALEHGNLMLLLDGLDEVNSGERPRVVQHLRDSLSRYNKCRAIITCRAAIYRGEFDESVERTLELIEFNDQQLRLFLRSWESDMNKRGKSVEHLMQTLHDRPHLLALARNPLLLTIIAHLYTDTNFVLPNSRVDFYRKSTDVLLEDEWHTEYKHLAKATDKRLVLQHLALYNQEATVRREQDRLSMERPVVLEQVRNTLLKLNLNLESADEVLDEIVDRSGLLLRIDGGERYQFAHLTLQEYFAATALRNDGRALLERFQTDHDAWRETVKLWCGLDHDSTELIQAIKEEDPLTAFECLAGAQEVHHALANELIDTFMARLGQNGVDDAVVKAFAAVASDTRPRGKAVFESLKKLLGTARERTRRIAAANALSLTNLPQAAYALVEHCMKQEELRTALVRMGDLAVPALHPLIERRPDEAMDDLLAIGTPLAARTLVPWLWHEDEQLSMRAAWRMAALMRKVGVEEALRDHPLTQEHTKAGTIDWVWEPFLEPGHTALPIIAGRVAFLLARAPARLAPALPQALDPRLVIPLCAILRRRELIPAPRSSDFRASPEYWELPTHLRMTEAAFVVKRMLTLFDPTPEWRLLLEGLQLEAQAGLLRRLDVYPSVTEQDWRNAFRPIVYAFDSTWWYYRAVVAIAMLLLGVAMLRFLPWPQVILSWLLLLAVGAAFWAMGRRRERNARNPLQNIIVPPVGSPGNLPRTRRGRLRKARILRWTSPATT